MVWFRSRLLPRISSLLFGLELFDFFWIPEFPKSGGAGQPTDPVLTVVRVVSSFGSTSLFPNNSYFLSTSD